MSVVLPALGVATGAMLSTLGGSAFASAAFTDDASERKRSTFWGLGLTGVGALVSTISAMELGRREPRARDNPPDDDEPPELEAYRDFHWGDESDEWLDFELPDYESEGLYAIGDLRRVDYETHKDGERATWFHEFEDPYPTLTATAAGELGPILGGGAYVTEAGIEG